MSTFRTAAEIGRTELGPRPLPGLTEQRAATGLSSVDTLLDNGLRVVAVHAPTVPMVELRLRIPFAGTDPLHAARAEVLAATILTGTKKRDRVAIDTDLALVGGELDAGVDPERLSISGNALVSGFDTLLGEPRQRPRAELGAADLGGGAERAHWSPPAGVTVSTARESGRNALAAAATASGVTAESLSGNVWTRPGSP